MQSHLESPRHLLLQSHRLTVVFKVDLAIYTLLSTSSRTTTSEIHSTSPSPSSVTAPTSIPIILSSASVRKDELEKSNSSPPPTQNWQLGGPKFGPIRDPVYRSIHWAGIGFGTVSPGPNRA